MNDMLKDMVMINNQNEVINIVVVDINNLHAPYGMSLIELPTDHYVEIGYIWDGENFKNKNGEIIFFTN